MSAVEKEQGGRGKRQPRKRGLAKSLKLRPMDALVEKRVRMAITRLSESGRLTGSTSQKLSVRVDPGLVSAAAERIGADNPTDVVNTALALMASPDPFVQWFMTTEDRLPEDFEIAV